MTRRAYVQGGPGFIDYEEVGSSSGVAVTTPLIGDGNSTPISAPDASVATKGWMTPTQVNLLNSLAPGASSILTVSSIAALRASSGYLTDTRALLGGYYADGDGGGGVFYWDASSSATDDAGTTIKPTAVVGAGRWIRLYTLGIVNPRWFGAKGDGFLHPLSDFFSSLGQAQVFYPHATSLTNQIDWAAIQAAVNLIASTSYALALGGTVQIPKGAFLSDQPIAIFGTVGVKLVGVAGHGIVGTGNARNSASVLYYTQAGSSRFIDARGTTGFALENMAVIFLSPSYTGVLVDLSHSSPSDPQNNTIRNCMLSGGLSVTVGTGARCLVLLSGAISCLIDNCVIGIAVQGIRFAESDGSYSNVHGVTNCQFVYHKYALVNAREDTTVVNCTFEGSGGCMQAAYFDDYPNTIASDVITFTFSASGKTITRSSGSWLADGWLVGMIPTVFEQVGPNIGDKTAITTLTATVMTMSGATLFDEATTSCRIYNYIATSDASPGIILTFAGSTITRSTGSWITDNFKVGQSGSIHGTASNNGPLAKVTSLSASVLSFAADTLTFSASGKTITRSSGSWFDDGWTVGLIPTVIGTSSNNGDKTAITTLTPTVMTMSGATLVDEASTSAVVYNLFQNAFVANTVASAGHTFVNETATAGTVANPQGPGPFTMIGCWFGDQFLPSTWLQFGGYGALTILGCTFVGNLRVMSSLSGDGLSCSGNRLISIQEPIWFKDGQFSGTSILGNSVSGCTGNTIVKNTGALSYIFMAGNTLTQGGLGRENELVSIGAPLFNLRGKMQVTQPVAITTAFALEIFQGSINLGMGTDNVAAYIGAGGPLRMQWGGGNVILNGQGIGRTALGFDRDSAGVTSLFQVHGAIATAYRLVTVNNTAIDDVESFVDIDASAGNVAVVLPDATTCRGRLYTIKRVDASGNTATVATVSGQKFDGAASPYVLASQNSTVTIVSNATDWRIQSKVA